MSGPLPPRDVRDAYTGPERRTPRADRRTASGLAHDKSLPVWARIMAIVGIPGSIAFFLVWTNAAALPTLQHDLTALRSDNKFTHRGVGRMGACRNLRLGARSAEHPARRQERARQSQS